VVTPARALDHRDAVMGVVVPARNEQQRIEACLTALLVAQEFSRLDTNGPAAVQIVVVADRCTDRTVEIVGGFPGVAVIRSDRGRVGAARAAGVAWLLRSPRVCWIASTDADSTVPPDWLITQWQHARAGTDLLLGTVRLTIEEELPATTVRQWERQHDLSDGHRHVHGANLGVRAATYRKVGGFADVAVHEDLALVQAVQRAGGVVVSTAASPVHTSARVTGRAPGGLSGYLRELLAESGAAPPERCAPTT